MRLRPYYGLLDYQYLEKWVENERVHALWCADMIPYPMRREALDALLERDAREWDGHAYIAAEDDGSPIGFFCYSVNAEENSGFLKFVVLDPEQRGRGYGTQMIGLALKYAFDITMVDFVQINVFSSNEGARRCYEKAGFVRKGITQAAFAHQGESWDRYHMVAVKK